jgi:hypothetical protein
LGSSFIRKCRVARHDSPGVDRWHFSSILFSRTNVFAFAAHIVGDVLKIPLKPFVQHNAPQVEIDDRAQLVLSVDNMKASVSGRESLNGAAEPERDLLASDVFDGTKSVRAKNRCNASRLETADRTFTNFLKLFGPLLFYLP